MSSIDKSKKVYLIVHGQMQLLETVKEKLTAKGFAKENMQMAGLDKAGDKGEYVGMVWPPMAPSEVIVSQITETGVQGGKGMGAWATVSQQEILRVPLK